MCTIHPCYDTLEPHLKQCGLKITRCSQESHNACEICQKLTSYKDMIERNVKFSVEDLLYVPMLPVCIKYENHWSSRLIHYPYPDEIKLTSHSVIDFSNFQTKLSDCVCFPHGFTFHAAPDILIRKTKHTTTTIYWVTIFTNLLRSGSETSKLHIQLMYAINAKESVIKSSVHILLITKECFMISQVCCRNM